MAMHLSDILERLKFNPESFIKKELDVRTNDETFDDFCKTLKDEGLEFRLEKITICPRNYNAYDRMNLKNISYLVDLKEVTITRFENFPEALFDLKNLVKLNFLSCSFTKEKISHKIKQLKNLKSLTIKDCNDFGYYSMPLPLYEMLGTQITKYDLCNLTADDLKQGQDVCQVIRGHVEFMLSDPEEGSYALNKDIRKIVFGYAIPKAWQKTFKLYSEEFLQSKSQTM